METVLQVLSGIAIVLGSAFCVIGGIGLLRLPDLFTRMHGAGITDTLGAGLVLIGLALLAATGLVAPGPGELPAADAAAVASEPAPHEPPSRLAAAQTVLKLLAILFFLLVTSPTSTHALASAALSRGLELVLTREEG